jgi:hypothetical protein
MWKYFFGHWSKVLMLLYDHAGIISSSYTIATTVAFLSGVCTVSLARLHIALCLYLVFQPAVAGFL